MTDIPTPDPTPGDSSWFTHDRFGLFIHWGLYALAARHEWVQHREEIPAEDYDVYFRHFDPDLYDPAAWASAASDAGMKYFVVTTKHHEGFCMWDSALTDYKSTNTPAGRDLIAPMVEAFRACGFRTGFYHSVIDWHHPQYVLDRHFGPYRNAPDREQRNASRDQAKYAEYLHGQVRELLTRFAPVDVLWMDFSYPKPDGSGKGRADWQSDKLYAMIRQLAPNIMLNDRLDMDAGWDFKTPEQTAVRQWVRVGGKPIVWEMCQTFSGSWGYHRDESTWKSVEQLVQLLIDCVSKGGNLLLNVGPTGRGEFDQRALDRLAGIGQWMRRHGRSIYGCTQAPDQFVCPRDCRLTWNPQTGRLYVHVFAWPPTGQIFLDVAQPPSAVSAGRIEYAQLLHDASQVKVSSPADFRRGDAQSAENSIQLNVPIVRPNVTVPVIELFVRDTVY